MTTALVFSALLVLLLPLRSDAQLRTWGVKAGLTSASQEFTYKAFSFDLSPDRRTGFCVSLFAEWLEGPLFSVSTELAYTQRGLKKEFDVTWPNGPEVIGTILINDRLDYLSLPLLATLHIPSPTVSPFLEFGPRFDLLLGHSSDMDAFAPVNDRFKPLAAGVTLGAGLTHQTLFPRPVRVEARYNWDLNTSYSTEVLDVSNNSFDVVVGVEF